jgi:hypothetical protein
MLRLSVLSVVLLVGSLVGCTTHAAYVPGTRIPYSDPNKSALDAVEEYRLAVERGDADALMLMAHPQYWEDSGTPSGSDDYGYDGLRNVLLTRLQKASEVRYSMRYLRVTQQCPGLKPGCHARVDVMIDASYTITDAFGKAKRPDKRDQNEFDLEWTCGAATMPGKPASDDNGGSCRWLFRSGM